MMRRPLGVVVVLVGLIGPTRAWAEPDPAAAKTLAAQAESVRESHDDPAAAVLFEAAYACDPHPLWHLAAGETWLAAIEPERALTHLSDALADPRLPATARERVARLIRSAEALKPIVAKAKQATREQAHAVAARAWREAWAERGPLAGTRYRLEEARALLRAREDAEAERLLQAVAAQNDLSQPEQLEVGEHLARLEARRLAATKAQELPESAAPAWLVVGGGVLVVGGVVALAVGASQRGDVRRAMDADPTERDMTRAEALALRSSADTLDTVGLVGGGVGLALAGTGVLLGTAGGLGFKF